MVKYLEGMRPRGRILFDSRVIVGGVGLILSVVLHELFHVLVHWGHITQFHLFPNPTTIIEITSITPAGYNPQYEEAIAYSITLLVLLATAAVIGKLHDAKDTRTFSQIVFPNDARMQQLSRTELFELARRTNTF